MNFVSRSRLRSGVSWLSIFALAGFSSQLSAQDQDQDTTEGTEDELMLEEIIVSARKRTQSIQDVPLSVRALGAKEMREKGLKDFDDYVRELTSVQFGTTSPGATTIAFRGAISQPTGFDTISSSILYLDEIPITRDGQNPDVRLIDMERIEALSGPQPTVYGAGSQSGTLKLVTRKPDLEGFSGWFEAGASTTRFGEESVNFSGAVNVPLVEDKLAVRLVGFYEFEGGYIDNVLGTTADYSPNSGDRDNADQVANDINDYEVYGGRANILWAPNDDWRITTGLIYQSATLGGLFDFNPAFGDLNTVKFKDESRKDDWYNIALTIEGDLGWADLVAAGGYHSRNVDYDFDSTAYMTQYRDNGLALAAYYTGVAQFPDYATCAYLGVCFINYNDFGANPTGTISLDQRVRSFVQEIRLTSKQDDGSRFDWVIGAFYENTNNDWDYLSFVDDFAANGGQGSIFSYYGIAPTNDWFDQGFRPGLTYNGLPGNQFNGFRADLESIAFFGELTFNITDTLSVTGGGRWFSTDFRTTENSLFVGTPSDDFDVNQNTTDFASRFNITWKPTNDVMVYATRSEGVRIGGRNGGVQTPAQQAVAPDAFDGDVLTNYEVGVKSTLFNGRVLANLTAFMMDWKDFQIQAQIPIAGPSIVNAGNASIDGIEAQFAVKWTEKFETSGVITYLDARLDDDVILGNGSVVAAFAGDRLPVTPEWKMSASAQYTTGIKWEALKDYEFYARFDYAYTGESVNATNASVQLFGVGAAVPQIQPDYHLGNFSIGLNGDNGRSIWFSVNNVWDERAVTYIWPRFGDNRQFTVRPREFRIGLYQEF